MPQLNKLLPRQVAAMVKNGVNKDRIVSDGGGLFLRLRKAGGANWLFVSARGGIRREAGLGPATTVPLDDARDIAAEMRRALAQGRNPFVERAATKREMKEAAKAATFGEFALDYIAGKEAGWKSPVHRAQWRSTLETYCAPIWNKRLEEIDTDDIVDILEPIWLTKAETASRVRGRIEKVLSAAMARGLRSKDSINPATLRGHLSELLASQKNVARRHHKALPFKEAPGFMAKLRARQALAARALEFVILTAARTNEVLGAKWGEVDFDANVWTVSAERMKAGVEHKVPLSVSALELLKGLHHDDVGPDDLIFAGGGKALSNMALSMALRRMGRDDITVHGMRSTFRDWHGEETKFPRELAEQALAHTIQNKAERAYRRLTAVEPRRELMEAWAKFLASAPVAKHVQTPVVKVAEKPSKPRRKPVDTEAEALQTKLFV